MKFNKPQLDYLKLVKQTFEGKLLMAKNENVIIALKHLVQVVEEMIKNGEGK